MNEELIKKEIMSGVADAQKKIGDNVIGKAHSIQITTEDQQQNTNTGGWNTGYRNTGDRNTGDQNTGNQNTGNQNTGGWNTGGWNTGGWNTGYRNTGYFNTITPEYTYIFNKIAKFSDWENAIKPNWIYFKLTDWIYSCDMTITEKEQNPTHETAGGYLRCYEFQQAALKSWNEATHEDRMLTYDLPNFDAEVAQEIFGIDFAEYLDNCDKEKGMPAKEIIELNGKRYQLID